MKSSLLKRTLRIATVALLCLVAAEATVRIYFALTLGPRILLFGTNAYRKQFALPVAENSAQRHGKQVGEYASYGSRGPTGYEKYFPGDVKYTDSPDHSESYPIRISNQGFRGPDFEVAKAPGVRRVLTLGASSTFGYHNRDDETYPHYLEQLLDADGRGRFEVINFSIPHATSGNIAAMLLGEGLALEPDFVTFYEGVNDAGIFEGIAPSGTAQYAWNVAADHFLLVQLTDTVVRPMIGGSSDGWSEDFARRRSQDFLANIDVIARACEEHGIRFIVATQQAKSQLLEASAMRGVTYAQEVALVEEKMARGEIGPKNEGIKPRNPVLEVVAHMNPARILFVHARLMRDLRNWAAQRQVQLVDVQAALDQRRDLILTWVHLAPEANRMVAAALAQQILNDAFPGAPAAGAPSRETVTPPNG